jgi:hypothetical protein
MNLILMTKYTLSTEFALAQVRGNNHIWRTSQYQSGTTKYPELSHPAVYTALNKLKTNPKTS